MTVKIPAGMPKGEHRILFSDADTMNRMQHAAAAGNRYMDIPETVSLLNQERGNNQLYVSLVEGRPTYYSDDKTLPALPASVLNVLQTRADRQPRAGRLARKRRPNSSPFRSIRWSAAAIRSRSQSK